MASLTAISAVIAEIDLIHSTIEQEPKYVLEEFLGGKYLFAIQNSTP